jgi:hypothetical protein
LTPLKTLPRRNSAQVMLGTHRMNEPSTATTSATIWASSRDFLFPWHRRISSAMIGRSHVGSKIDDAASLIAPSDIFHTPARWTFSRSVACCSERRLSSEGLK